MRLDLGLVLLLPLHPPILEPNFNLPFRETKSVCNFDPPSPGEVAIKVEFLLQLERLIPRVRLSSSFPLCCKLEGKREQV